MFPYSWLGLPHIYPPAPQYILTAIRDSSIDCRVYSPTPSNSCALNIKYNTVASGLLLTLSASTVMHRSSIPIWTCVLTGFPDQFLLCLWSDCFCWRIFSYRSNSGSFYEKNSRTRYAWQEIDVVGVIQCFRRGSSSTVFTPLTSCR